MKAAGIEPLVVRKLPPGRYGDGGGLYLLVKPPGAKQQAAGEKDGGRFWRALMLELPAITAVDFA